MSNIFTSLLTLLSALHSAAPKNKEIENNSAVFPDIL